MRKIESIQKLSYLLLSYFSQEWRIFQPLCRSWWTPVPRDIAPRKKELAMEGAPDSLEEGDQQSRQRFTTMHTSVPSCNLALNHLMPRETRNYHIQIVRYASGATSRVNDSRVPYPCRRRLPRCPVGIPVEWRSCTSQLVFNNYRKNDN